MNTFPKKLATIIGGLALVGAIASGLTLVVKYKPWGVPDVLREDYDNRVAKINQHNLLIESLENQDKPQVRVQVRTRNIGLVAPNTTLSQTYSVRNLGQLPLHVAPGKTQDSIELDFENEIIEPGGEASVTMTWQSGKPSESFQVTAEIKTDDPLQGSISLSAVGKVRSELIVPETLDIGLVDPMESKPTSFVVYSQLWKEMEVETVSSGSEYFDWHASPIPVNNSMPGATTAWLVHVESTGTEYGIFSDTLTVKVRDKNGQKEWTKEVAVKGKVRSPVAFYNKDIHFKDGLDIGTHVSGNPHDVHLLVRIRGDLERRIEVLDIEPKQLEASLEPLREKGNYRLTLTVPEDCPMVVFNMPQKHGFVSVGDPQDKNFSNWFPLHGAVVDVGQ
jgi:hypothetical protein